MPKGFIVNVYKFPLNDCTNGGVTGGDTKSVVLIGRGVPEIYEPSDEIPALYLDPDWPYMLRAIPEERDAQGKLKSWWMDGGNFVYCCDSRFRAINGGHPIPVHDRCER